MERERLRRETPFFLFMYMFSPANSEYRKTEFIRRTFERLCRHRGRHTHVGAKESVIRKSVAVKEATRRQRTHTHIIIVNKWSSFVCIRQFGECGAQLSDWPYFMDIIRSPLWILIFRNYSERHRCRLINSNRHVSSPGARDTCVRDTCVPLERRSCGEYSINILIFDK